MKIKDYHIAYFLGIGGIGMSAIARYFLKEGYDVAGYDRTPTSLTDELQAEGMAIHFDDALENIPSIVQENKDKVLVIYTPAIPADHQEYNYLKNNNYQIMKRSQVLGLIAANHFTVAVAGTHGKTTTSAMIAHILKDSGKGCTAFLGGILKNYNSNLLLNDNTAESDIMVVEADEYDRSFLTLFPSAAVVTSADADHLDIYGDKNAVSDSFRSFIGQIKRPGHLVIKDGLKDDLVQEINGLIIESYGQTSGNCHSENIIAAGSDFHFDLVRGSDKIEGFNIQVPGFHNVENAVAAAVITLQLGVPRDKVMKALASYQGVKRRFDYIIKNRDLVFIDDYAHHPVEIQAFLRSTKAVYPDKKVTAIFQPHLYTRTRDFADEFGKSLSLADEVILLDIYPAREVPIEGITSDIIFRSIEHGNKTMCKKEELLSLMGSKTFEVVATIGAGDIDKLVNPIKELLLLKNNHAEADQN